MIRSPEARKGATCGQVVTLLDVMPTVLEWFNVTYPKYHILKPSQPTQLTGTSLLHLLTDRSSGTCHLFISR